MLFMALLFTTPLYAFERLFLNERTVIFENAHCELTDTCSLKKVIFREQQYRLGSEGDYSYGTALYAWYETNSLDTLEEYVFVQFIKGCSFASGIDNETTYVMNRRKYFGEWIVFKHPHWVIDSTDKDPVYNSYPGYKRHFFYRWNEGRGSTYWKTERYYGQIHPIFPELYISDLPNLAKESPNNRAYNVSLEFQIGIYRTEDVPTEIQPDNITFAKPLFSFEWSSSFVFNHDTKTFEQPDEIVPLCL